MKVFRSARIAFLFLAAFLFQTDKSMAVAATVPPGACLYALDSTASRAFQIAGAQSVYRKRLRRAVLTYIGAGCDCERSCP
jgi:hypothetical protein